MASTLVTVNPDDLRKALSSLTLAASGFTGGRGREAMKKNLKEEIHSANAVLRAIDAENKHASDPEKLVRDYIDGGGNWQLLVSAISRLGLEGATKK